MRARPLLLLVLALTACAGPAAPEGASTLHARNLLTAPGAPIEIGFHAGGSGVQLRPEFTPQDAQLRICGDAIAEGCLEHVAWGVRVPIRGSGIETLTFETDRLATLSFTAEFFPLGPSIEARLPRVPAAPSEEACRDNACRAVFELLPIRTGTLEAEAMFEGEQGELAILSGRILARSETATGVPYRVADAATGAGPLSVAAQLDAGSEFAVVVGQRAGSGAGGMTGIELTMRWPA